MKNTSPFDISEKIPGSDTAEALQEVQRMKTDPTVGKTYTDVDQMMEELLAAGDTFSL